MRDRPLCVLGESSTVHVYDARYAEALCGEGNRLVGGPVRIVTGRSLTCAKCMARLARTGRDLPPAA